jgi:Protein of unknown function (DUF2845)
MKPIQSMLSVAVVLLSGLSSDIRAESLRCDGKLVAIGDSMATVLEKCGDPMLQDTLCIPVQQYSAPPNPRFDGTVINVTPCEDVDEWTYNPGPGRFLTTLRFVRGELKTMKYGARVR